MEAPCAIGVGNGRTTTSTFMPNVLALVIVAAATLCISVAELLPARSYPFARMSAFALGAMRAIV